MAERKGGKPAARPAARTQVVDPANRPTPGRPNPWLWRYTGTSV